MRLLLDSFLRSIAYCLDARVIALSFVPLILMVALALGLSYFFWDGALDWVRGALEASSIINSVWEWLHGIGAGGLKVVVVPLIVIFAVTPLIVVVSLLLVALMMTPALTNLVAERRYPLLERKRGSSSAIGLIWSLGSTVLALIALLVSIPLWLVPPLIFVLPPLIWGWLTYRVMAFDALVDHASAEERREIFQQHRGKLLMIGIVCGYMTAAPSLLWASGALFAAAFVILVPLAIWIYTLVFAFSSLWYAHYCLAALLALRSQAAALAPSAAVDVPSAFLPGAQALPLPHDTPTDPTQPR